MKEKDQNIAFILSLFIGHLGIDRMYIGHVGVGLAKLFTLGGLYIWWLVDLFLIRKATRAQNEMIRAQLRARAQEEASELRADETPRTPA